MRAGVIACNCGDWPYCVAWCHGERASREGQSGPTLSDQPSTEVPERLGPDSSRR